MLTLMERSASVPDDSYDPAVRIVPYDPAWPERFVQEAARLWQALAGVAVRIDHVGSTAVPGLAAKPIIDIQVSVHALEPLEAYRVPLEALGYLFVFNPEMPDFHFFGKPPERPRSYHIHVIQAGGPHEQRHLVVRDFLRAHPEVAREYAGLKRAVAEQHPGDRLSYMAGKEAFVVELERRALAWAAWSPQ
jgi:GrpB-like predicted nucleotidyltransferase (UPF0157 family)